MLDVGVPLKCSLKRTAPKQSADRKSKSMRAHAQGRRALSSQNGSPGGPLARRLQLPDPLEVNCRRLVSVTQRQHLLPTHTLSKSSYPPPPRTMPPNKTKIRVDCTVSFLYACCPYVSAWMHMSSISVRMLSMRGNAHARGPRASRTQTAACSLYRICMQEIKPQSLSHLLD